MLTLRQVEVLPEADSTVALLMQDRLQCGKETALCRTDKQHTVIIFAFRYTCAKITWSCGHNHGSHAFYLAAVLPSQLSQRHTIGMHTHMRR